MKKELFKIDGIPAVLYGDAAEKVYLFVHGKCGCKEEAEDLANLACERGFQVLGVDLPGHGERANEMERFVPWEVVPELMRIIRYCNGRWKTVSLRANSIGAYFSLLAFPGEKLMNCLFVSPVPNMEKLIADMMRWPNVSETQLEKAGEIATSFGETLSWRYLSYARQHPITAWPHPTAVLYAGRDNLTSRSAVDAFVQKFHCRLTVMDEGEHWFHTLEQMDVLHAWTEKEI